MGIKHIDPSIFATADLRRCSTCQLQHSLLKVALLLGVRVRLGAAVEQLDTAPGALPGNKRLDVLVDASGARCGLLGTFGFAQTVALRSARAIGIVLSLANHKRAAELELRESTWSQQYFQHEFAELQRHSGVALENLVYYRSSGAFAEAATHYCVMTTTSDALHAFGALRQLALPPSELCAAANVDHARLEAYARAAVAAFVPLIARQPLVPGQLSLFDFSTRKQSSHAAVVVPGSALGGTQQTCCLVTRVGDALQEPFWPEGLGINRGFLGVYDCADLVQRAAPLLLPPLGQPSAAEADFAALLKRREDLYALTKRLSATNRKQELRPHLDSGRRLCYAIDPATRYASWADVTLRTSAPPKRPRMSFHVGVMSSPRV